MKIAIIGHGNVATHMMKAFAGSSVHAVQVNSRTLSDLPGDADLYLICVKDDAIADVAALLDSVSAVVAHTSGSVGIEVLDMHRHRGVWYPMQTFSRNDMIDYASIPVFIEASDVESLSLLRRVAESFATTVVEADSERRKALHLAAVFACNFTNRLHGIAAEVLREAGLNFELMLPLINQSVAKLSRMTPSQAQTGPASRGDSKVCQAQMQMLASRPELQEIYRLLSESIANAGDSKMLFDNVLDNR